MNVLGYHNYLKDLSTVKNDWALATVDLNKVPTGTRFPLFLDLFFLDTPNPENGHTWGVTLSDTHEYKNYLPLCMIIDSIDGLQAINVSEDIPNAKLVLVPQSRQVNFIILKVDKH